MKKITFLFLMMLLTALVPSSAFAGKYNSLKFTSSTGETYTVATHNLEILVQGENLTFSNTDLKLPLSSLVSMEFAWDDNTTKIEELVFDPNCSVMVYNVNGTPVGFFDSYSEALDSIGKGIYVVKDSNGNSLKVNVEK